MKNECAVLEAPTVSLSEKIINESRLHPAWRAFILYCCRLRHGEIQVLKIQDGVPVLAEVTKKKVKFPP